MKKFKNYIIISVTLISVIIMFISVYNNSIQKFTDIGISKQNELNQSLMPCNYFVEALTIYGNNFYDRGIIDKDMELYKLLKYNPDHDNYSLDAVSGTEAQQFTGNITGLGRIPQKGVLKADLDLAFNYNKFFYTFYQKLPNIAQISYTSKNNFVNRYPWVSSNDYAFSYNLLNMEYYTGVTPKNNPYRNPYWTHAYLAHAGSDIAVSLSSPIYKGDIFMGAISISLKTNWLSNMLKSEYKGYIVDETYTVIASNQKISPERKMPMLDDLLNSPKDFLQKLNKTEINSIHRVNQYYVYKTHLNETPWIMIMMVPVYSIISKSLLLTLPVCIIGILLIISINEIEHRKKVEEEIRDYALTDSLTGLRNRRFLDTVMEVDAKYAISSNLPLSGIMMDLDHFKYINDTWGHPVGDEVLKQCAEKIKAFIRSTDIMVRMGGEEFMILLPQTDSSRAYEIADMIRMELEQDRHPVAGKYTASFGVAGKWEGESINSFYRRIDEALYHAKEEGRNCVIFYDQFYKNDIELE